MPITATALVLALPDNRGDDLLWHLDPFDESIIKLTGDPRFVPSATDPNKGALVWTFDVLAAGATELRLLYATEGGTVGQQFFVTVSVQELSITPF